MSERPDLGLAIIGAGRTGPLGVRLAAGHPAVRFITVSDRDAAKARALSIVHYQHAPHA